MNTICAIFARGGSKGIPRKNIKELHGKPLIEWTIECAKKCNSLDRIIVSTDDNEISSEVKFEIHIKHSSSSSTISLGFMVVSNSETVLLNGTTALTKGTDYDIDYFTGTLTLKSERALDPTAEIKITFDQNELVSFDQKVIAGSYFLYEINDIDIKCNN